MCYSQNTRKEDCSLIALLDDSISIFPFFLTHFLLAIITYYATGCLYASCAPQKKKKKEQRIATETTTRKPFASSATKCVSFFFCVCPPPPHPKSNMQYIYRNNFLFRFITFRQCSGTAACFRLLRVDPCRRHQHSNLWGKKQKQSSCKSGWILKQYNITGNSGKNQVSIVRNSNIRLAIFWLEKAEQKTEGLYVNQFRQGLVLTSDQYACIDKQRSSHTH